MDHPANSTLTAARLVRLLGPPDPGVPAYRWLADTLRGLVTDGLVLHGTRLPSERALVAELGLSRTTVTRAYAALRERGYAEARQGSGTRAALPGGPVTGGGEPLPDVVPDRPAPSDAIDLTSAAPPAIPGLAMAYVRAAESVARYVSGMGYYPYGLPSLRAVLAQRFTERGLATDPEQIIVTTGALESAAVAARALLGPGRRIAVETPTYPGLLAAVRPEASRVVPVPVSAEGIDPAAWRSALSSSGAQVASVIADFQNPTGNLLDAQARQELGRAWRAYDVVGLIDETLVDVVLDPVEMPAPMAAFAPRTVTVGGVSKSMWGGLRIGWLRASRELLPGLARARLSLGLGAPVLEQLVVEDWLTGDWGAANIEHLQRIRQQRDVLLEAVRTTLPEWACVVPTGGLSLWWHLPRSRSTVLAQRARDEGLLLPPGSVFAASGRGLEPWIRTPYVLQAETLRVAVDRLARAWARAA